MNYTRDLDGLQYRLVCFECYNKLMRNGYDSELIAKVENKDDKKMHNLWKRI